MPSTALPACSESAMVLLCLAALPRARSTGPCAFTTACETSTSRATAPGKMPRGSLTAMEIMTVSPSCAALLGGGRITSDRQGHRGRLCGRRDGYLDRLAGLRDRIALPIGYGVRGA